MNGDRCVRCGETGDDRRTLWMACLYEMSEMDIPFREVTPEGGSGRFYTLLVCKGCRAEWMQAIERWFRDVEKCESPGSGIFIRRNGATIEVSEEEWHEMYPGREPVRVR